MSVCETNGDEFMAGLILKLRPYEELMINGVVVENGDRKARLRVKTDGAHILRLRDAMKPEEATTPLKRAYYIAQMAVAGQLANAEAADLVRHALKNYDGPGAEETQREVDIGLGENEFYKVMRYLGEVIAAEPARPSVFTQTTNAQERPLPRIVGGCAP
jgi:flagellar biosynthesis repressor protein FlbT